MTWIYIRNTTVPFQGKQKKTSSKSSGAMNRPTSGMAAFHFGELCQDSMYGEFWSPTDSLSGLGPVWRGANISALWRKKGHFLSPSIKEWAVPSRAPARPC